MTIVILFHHSGCRYSNHFYLQLIQRHHQAKFASLVSYNYFIELMSMALITLCTFMKSCYGKPTCISYINSTGLSVCSLFSVKLYQPFVNNAGWGKPSTSKIFGFKFHLKSIKDFVTIFATEPEY